MGSSFLYALQMTLLWLEVVDLGLAKEHAGQHVLQELTHAEQRLSTAELESLEVVKGAWIRRRAGRE